MTIYQQRKSAGLCVRCGGASDRNGVYCARCHSVDQNYRLKRAAKVHVALSGVGGTSMERIYSFIIRGGKIKPKAPLEAAEMQRRSGL